MKAPVNAGSIVNEQLALHVLLQEHAHAVGRQENTFLSVKSGSDIIDFRVIDDLQCELRCRERFPVPLGKHVVAPASI